MSELYWSDEDYHEMLKHHKQLIEKGETLVLEDSDTIGDKYTHASWGLCSRESKDKTRPPYRQDVHKCPFDKDESETSFGCFYRCRLFQGPRPTKDEAIKLYEIIGKVMDKQLKEANSTKESHEN